MSEIKIGSLVKAKPGAMYEHHFGPVGRIKRFSEYEGVLYATVGWSANDTSPDVGGCYGLPVALLELV